METGDEGKGNLLQVPVNGIGSWSRVGGTCDGDARRWAGVTTVRGRLRLESGWQRTNTLCRSAANTQSAWKNRRSTFPGINFGGCVWGGGGVKLLDFHLRAGLSQEVLALARSDKPDDECSGESQPLGSLDDEDELQLCHEQLICHLEIHVQPLPKKGSGGKKKKDSTTHLRPTTINTDSKNISAMCNKQMTANEGNVESCSAITISKVIKITTPIIWPHQRQLTEWCSGT